MVKFQVNNNNVHESTCYCWFFFYLNRLRNQNSYSIQCRKARTVEAGCLPPPAIGNIFRAVRAPGAAGGCSRCSTHAFINTITRQTPAQILLKLKAEASHAAVARGRRAHEEHAAGGAVTVGQQVAIAAGLMATHRPLNVHRPVAELAMSRSLTWSRSCLSRPWRSPGTGRHLVWVGLGKDARAH